MRYLAASGRVTYPCDLGRDRHKFSRVMCRRAPRVSRRRPGHAVFSVFDQMYSYLYHISVHS